MSAYRIIGKLSLPRFEALYCQASPLEFPYRGKGGVSVDGKIRGEQISCSIKNVMGRDVELWTMMAAPVLFPYRMEKILHWILDQTSNRCKTFEGTNGGTEWHWSNNLLTFSLFFGVFVYFNVSEPFYKSLFVCLIPAPLDHCLLILLIALTQYAALGFGIYYAFRLVF